MNYEQKYKEAIESIKRIYNQADSYGKELMEKEFPDLTESKDERIRKEIIELVHFFYCSSSVYEHHVSEDDMIAWLEKQGEEDIIDLKEYAKGILKGAATHLMIWIDENLADGNMCLSNMECEDLENAMVNAKWDKIYNYIKKKVEKQGEKSSWSEEDEKRISRITDFIWKNRKGDTDEIYQQEQDVNWLKSLKSQSHWKPSKEQMEALWNIIPHIVKSEGDIDAFAELSLLYNELKRL